MTDVPNAVTPEWKGLHGSCLFFLATAEFQSSAIAPTRAMKIIAELVQGGNQFPVM